MKRWLDGWSVNEQEPTWVQTIVVGIVFIGALVAIYLDLTLICAGITGCLPR